MQQPGGPTAAEALEICYELNKLLDCGLDKETLSVCIALVENGVNPEASGGGSGGQSARDKL